MEEDKDFPRELTVWERDLLLWLLPSDRSGYGAYREIVQKWNVAAQGRRGEGNFILAPLDEKVDNESPLPQVAAWGVVETPEGEISVTMRERLGNQLEFEIAKLGPGEVRGPVNEVRRWTLSTWSPGEPCPRCGNVLRELRMMTTHRRPLVLAICAGDEKLWIYDSATGMNHPIPHTNFYNELMLHKRIRDPETALDPKRLFADLQSHTDADLISAFQSYNQVRTKIPLEDEIVIPPERPRSLFSRIISKFKNDRS